MTTPLQQTAPLRHKLFFWFLLSLLSTFFAEVTIGSQRFPFFTPEGLVWVHSLYGLHTLILAHIVFYYGKPRFYTLYLAGVIFGLYEFYITKVLWVPSWGPPMISVGGIAAVEVVVLALFWHPFLAFVLPVIIGETKLTHSRETLDGLPPKLQRIFLNRKRAIRWIVSLAILQALSHSGTTPSPLMSFASICLSAAVPLLFALFWLWITKNRHYTMRELLPGRWGTAVLGILLILYYIAWGIKVRPEILPGLAGQAPVWVIYAMVIYLFILSLNKSRRMRIEPIPGQPFIPSFTFWILLAILFSSVSAFTNLAFGKKAIILIFLLWMAAVMLGPWTFFQAIRDLLPRRVRTPES